MARTKKTARKALPEVSNGIWPNNIKVPSKNSNLKRFKGCSLVNSSNLQEFRKYYPKHVFSFSYNTYRTFLGRNRLSATAQLNISRVVSQLNISRVVSRLKNLRRVTLSWDSIDDQSLNLLKRNKLRSISLIDRDTPLHEFKSLRKLLKSNSNLQYLRVKEEGFLHQSTYFYQLKGLRSLLGLTLPNISNVDFNRIKTFFARYFVKLRSLNILEGKDIHGDENFSWNNRLPKYFEIALSAKTLQKFYLDFYTSKDLDLGEIPFETFKNRQIKFDLRLNQKEKVQVSQESLPNFVEVDYLGINERQFYWCNFSLSI